MKQNTFLVTGGSGFIGSEVVFQLMKSKQKILIVDIKMPPSRLRESSNISFIKHDLRGNASIKEKISHVDYFIHIAAEVGNARYGAEHEATMLSSNARIDLNCIKLAYSLQVKQFIYTSSSLVYEQSEEFPFNENKLDHIPPPALGYSFEKLFGERLCIAYQKEFGMIYTICRLFNAYGKNSIGVEDPHGHVIADLVNKVKSGEYPVKIIGSGDQKRNFTHVTDVASGIIKTVANRKAVNQAFNIGSKEEYSVLDILKILWKLSGKKKILKVTHLKPQDKDLHRNKPDVNKAEKQMNWAAKISMQDGLRDLL